LQDKKAGLSIHADYAVNRAGMDQHAAIVETDAELVVMTLLESQWSDESLYDFRARGDYPYAQSFYGPDQIVEARQRWFEGLENIQFRADHICEVPYLGDAVDVALRWSMTADHAGEGHYGAPTGETIYILGVSHFRILDGIIREEATLWDDVGVMRMIEGIRLGL
ncbi:MAG: ester cyclase, partial [Pseudomonadota bacterium]